MVDVMRPEYKNLRVLVADDDRNVVNLLCRLLRELGFGTIESVDNGLSAAQKLEERLEADPAIGAPAEPLYLRVARRVSTWQPGRVGPATGPSPPKGAWGVTGHDELVQDPSQDGADRRA